MNLFADPVYTTTVAHSGSNQLQHHLAEAQRYTALHRNPANNLALINHYNHAVHALNNLHGRIETLGRAVKTELLRNSPNVEQLKTQSARLQRMIEKYDIHRKKLVGIRNQARSLAPSVRLTGAQATSISVRPMNQIPRMDPGARYLAKNSTRFSDNVVKTAQNKVVGSPRTRAKAPTGPLRLPNHPGSRATH